MYKLMKLISVLIRQFCVPNPFEVLGEGLIITISNAPVLLSPILLNWLVEPIVHAITFIVVGMYYDRGSEPALGSFLYLVFYCLHIFILWLMSKLGFTLWAVMIILMIYGWCLRKMANIRYSLY